MSQLIEHHRRYLDLEAQYRAAQVIVKTSGGAFVKEARQRLNLTQRELAAHIGVDFSYISKVENGHALLSKDAIRAILALLEPPQNDAETE